MLALITMLASCGSKSGKLVAKPRTMPMKVDKYWLVGNLGVEKWKFVNTIVIELDTLFDVGDTIQPIRNGDIKYVHIVRKK